MRKQAMKTKTLARTLTAAFALFTTALVAYAGDIYSIDLVEHALYGGMVPTVDEPLTIGQKAVIRVRMIDRNFGASSHGSWRFKPTSSFTALTAEAMKDSVFAPGIGLMLGDRGVVATYLATAAVATPAKSYTDLFFEYTVQPGDLALPALLMTSVGKAPGEAYASSYYLANSDYWQISNDSGDTVDFSFVDPGALMPDDVPGEPQTYSVTGRGMGLYIKSVDFDTNYIDVDEDLWRIIGLQQTTTTGNGLPTLAVQGSATSAATVYVWVDDESIAVPLKADGAVSKTDDVGTRTLLTVSIPAGETTKSFRIKGLKEGEANVCMSSSMYRTKDDGGAVIKNWVTRKIKVQKTDPTVSLTLTDVSGNETAELYCTTNYQQYVGMINVTLSQAPTGTVTVAITPNVDVFGGEIPYIAVSETTSLAQLPWERCDTNVTFKASDGKGLTRTLYVYALGSATTLENTATEFVPVLGGDSKGEYQKTQSCRMKLRRVKPVVVSPVNGDAINDIVLGSDYALDMIVAGSYREMHTAGWSVNYLVKGDGFSNAGSISGLAPNAETGELPVTIAAADLSLQAKSLEIWITAPDGSVSAHVSAAITVSAGKSASARLEAVDGRSSGTYAEDSDGAKVARVYFTLSKSYAADTWAFLRPSDATIAVATNAMSCSAFTTTGDMGVYIPGGQTNSTEYAEVILKDGNATGVFTVEICTSSVYSPAAVAGYKGSESLTITVTNVVPRVNSVVVSGSTVRDGETLTGKTIPLGIAKSFRVKDLFEPSEIDRTMPSTSSDAFLTEWYFDDDPNGGEDGDGWHKRFGDPLTMSISHEFTMSGTRTVKVRCQDKDMRKKNANLFSEEMTFQVTVDEKAAVVITPRYGADTYDENQTGVNASAFDVSLIGAPVISGSTSPLIVEISVSKVDPYGNYKTSDITLSRTTIEFANGVDGRNDSSHFFYFKALNGTDASMSSGFELRATVKNPGIDSDGKTWDDGSYIVYIGNVKPVIKQPIESLDSDGNPIPIKTTIGNTLTVNWNVDDVAADRGNLTITFATSDGDTKTYSNAALTGSHSFSFNSAGDSKTVTMSVYDADDPTPTTVTLYYDVAASKVLNIAAVGPSDGAATISLSSRYAKQQGRGSGHVYLSNDSDIKFTREEAYTFFWNCGVRTKVNAYAYGYPAHTYDNGALDGDTTDYQGRRSNYYYNNDRDSFFYGWLTADEPGGSAYIFTPSPELRGEKKQTATRGVISLPEGKSEGEEGYADTYAEAIFSMEYARADNMGDINFDGVPDYFATYEYSNGALVDTESGNGSDLAGVSGNNADNDFYPNASLLGSTTLIPGAVSGWSGNAQPFGAAKEIRGYHDGLNFGMFWYNKLEYDYGWASDLSLSENEKRALLSKLIARHHDLLPKGTNSWANTTKYWTAAESGDWNLITSIFSKLIRKGTTYDGSNTAEPIYWTKDQFWSKIKSNYGTEGFGTTNWLTNVVSRIDNITVVQTNLYWIHWYKTNAASPTNHVAATNLLLELPATAIYTNSENEIVYRRAKEIPELLPYFTDSAGDDVFDRNPCDNISIDDINIDEWLDVADTDDAAREMWIAQQATTKEYIDWTWRHFNDSDIWGEGSWGWTCENRTDPTIDDTDGDGVPDGYEYFIWYDAVVGTSGNRLVGCRFSLDDIESYDNVITSDTIASLYNPNKYHNFTSTDTDNDGITDYEEFLLGTSPLHWDTDRDGLNDLYELTYNINPQSSGVGHNGGMNSDGDFMAYAHGADDLPELQAYAYIYKAVAENGEPAKLWMLSTNVTEELRLACALDPSTNYVTVTGNGFEVKKLGGYYIPPTQATKNFTNNYVRAQTIKVDLSSGPVVVTNTVTFLHHQVHDYFGFDPRTAWYIDPNGSISKTQRWIQSGVVVESGKPVNTTGYTARDEYLLLKYRYIVGLNNLKTDQQNVSAGRTTVRALLTGRTTNPNTAFESTSFSGDSELTFKQAQHGADTDGDGIPDGWELYIGISPNSDFKIAKGATGYDNLYWDGVPGVADSKSIPETSEYDDGLSVAYEFAGTDSCGAYADCPSIYAFHPSQDTGLMKGWYNKFLPTDPRNSDTDGDLIIDGEEGSSWSSAYVINRWGQMPQRGATVTHYSKYGTTVDSGSGCIAGGGFNPCSIDTDRDGLPDPWERQYAGILFNGLEVSTDKDFKVFKTTGVPPSDFYDDIRAAVSAYALPTNEDFNGYHVMMGMDGTVDDARTESFIGASECDWDGDGLQNWQEYMVQAMRQFRYDDDRTPLMGYDSPRVDVVNATMVPGMWTNEFLKVNYYTPFNKVELQFLRDRMGYTNFASWALRTPNYHGELGYFIDPPRTWDYARAVLGYKYMLPRSRVHCYMSFTSPSIMPTLDDAGNALYAFKDLGESNDPAFEEWFKDWFGFVIYTNDTDKVWTNKTSSFVTLDIGGGSMNDFELMPLMTTNNAAWMLTERTFEPLAGGVPSYFGTDPRLWDTDKDGMDDYYELFHGLNPILGAISSTEGYVSGMDVIGETLWKGEISPWKNAWIGWTNDKAPAYDPIRFPWMMGVAECDADGDGLRNYEEYLQSDIADPSATHTDPTPLWMTDISGSYKETMPYHREVAINPDSGNPVNQWITGIGWVVKTNNVPYSSLEADPIITVSSPSYTKLFYANEISSVALWDAWSLSSYPYLTSFEENEGYDTDNDWRSDGVELENTTEATSDPLNFGDPQRRQSVWFGGPGNEGMLVSVEPGRRNYDGMDLYKQFTVEVWVRPENATTPVDKYIVSRGAWYGGWDLQNPESLVRLNFAIGIDREGKAFAEIQNSTEVSCRLTGSALVDNRWTHLAATFDGGTLAIYVNGMLVSTIQTKIVPANGVAIVAQDPQQLSGWSSAYSQLYSVVTIGARPTKAAIFNYSTIASASSWSDIATDFFQGSVDEVRIWDGARSEDEISNNYLVRYTPALAKKQREDVFIAYASGARRNSKSSVELPAELMQHFDFSTLAGATDAAYVQKTPAGFAANVLASVRRPDTGADISDSVKVSWWRKLVESPLGSKVYDSPYVIPWVEDTMAHMPSLSGRTTDSVYWNEYYAGYTPASMHGWKKYSFPNGMNPYNTVNLCREGSYFRQKISMLANATNTTSNAEEDSLISEDSVLSRYLYESRRGFSARTDLVPIGSVYAKRLSDSWDGQGAESSWATTVDGTGASDQDANDDGLTSWAIALGYDTMDKYMRALARGLLPDGTIDVAFRNTEDVDGDGMPDWWEKYYGVYADGPDDDSDIDGLSNYQEYLISEVYYEMDPVNFRRLSPRSGCSSSAGQAVSDYFLKYKKFYYGELFADHDHIEDWWEASQPAEVTVGNNRIADYSRYVYDANRSVLREGRSNWANARVKVQGLDTMDVEDAIVTNYTVVTKTGTWDELNNWRMQKLAEIKMRNYIRLGYGNYMKVDDDDETFSSDNVFVKSYSETGNYDENGSAIVTAVYSIRSFEKALVTKTIHLHQKVDATFLYNGKDDTSKQNKSIVVKAWGPKANIGGTPDAVWVVKAVDEEKGDNLEAGFLKTTLETPRVGYLRDGANMFVAYMADSYSDDIVPEQRANMPYGVAKDVAVGYLNSAPLAIELTDTDPSILRVDMARALARQAAYAEETIDLGTSTDGGTSDVATSCYADVSQLCTDRGFWDADALSAAYYIGMDTTNVTSNVLVRVLRSAINDKDIRADKVFSSDKVLVSRTLSLGSQSFFTEADLLAELRDGEGDIDWGGPVANYKANGELWQKITNAYYRIVVYGGTTTGTNYNNNLTTMFVNKFEYGSEQTPVTGKRMLTYAGQPTFSWRHENSIGKAYPAFRLRIWESDKTTCIFDSGVQRAPAREADGVGGVYYSWTAPIWPGSMTPSNKVFKADTTYYWGVSMLDAKFTTPGASETKSSFSMQETSESGDATDYGIIPVKVKYMGPGMDFISTTAYKKCLRVEAFETPDFVGVPLGVGYVTDALDLASETVMPFNARITGLPADKEYYVRAFIDSDGDGVLDPWESWGYACYRGSNERRDFYTPRPIKVGNAVTSKDCVVYVEDADTNCNMVPDIWEYEKTGLDETKSLSPYIAFTASDDRKKAALDAVVGGTAGGKILLSSAAAPSSYAYPSALTAYASGTVSANELLLLGVEIDTSDSTHIKITSFSLETGITLEVVVDDSFESAIAAGFDTGIIQIKVEYATTLDKGADWKSVGNPVEIAFPLMAGTTNVGVEELESVNNAIKSLRETSDGSCYFRVSAIAIE